MGVLRFRLMVKRGPRMRPQASEGEAQHGLFWWTIGIGQETFGFSCTRRLAKLLRKPTTAIFACCARRERPRRCAAEQRDEVASPEVEHGLLLGTRCASLPQAQDAPEVPTSLEVGLNRSESAAGRDRAGVDRPLGPAIAPSLSPPVGDRLNHCRRESGNAPVLCNCR